MIIFTPLIMLTQIRKFAKSRSSFMMDGKKLEVPVRYDKQAIAEEPDVEVFH